MKAGRILVVDDEPHNIKLLSDFLKEGNKIMVAKEGEPALKVAWGPNPPDLILLDIIMPGLDGYEVCRRLKADDRSMHIPVIFITALDHADDETKGFNLGAVDFITKPFNPVIVKARVNTHLQLKRKTDLLEQLASLDGLTELPNRRSLDENLEKEIRRARRDNAALSLILIDIDHFKKYNDHYGHVAGDGCLKKVARVIKEAGKRGADFAARYGGEEFAVILPDTDAGGATQVAENTCWAVAALKLPHAASPIADHVSISIGVSTVLPKNEELSPSDLITAADTALYQAKESGRNRAVHYQTSSHGDRQEREVALSCRTQCR